MCNGLRWGDHTDATSIVQSSEFTFLTTQRRPKRFWERSILRRTLCLRWHPHQEGASLEKVPWMQVLGWRTKKGMQEKEKKHAPINRGITAYYMYYAECNPYATNRLSFLSSIQKQKRAEVQGTVSSPWGTGYPGQSSEIVNLVIDARHFLNDLICVNFCQPCAKPLAIVSSCHTTSSRITESQSALKVISDKIVRRKYWKY